MTENDMKLFKEAYEAITKEAVPKEAAFNTAEMAFIIAAYQVYKGHGIIS